MSYRHILYCNLNSGNENFICFVSLTGLALFRKINIINTSYVPGAVFTKGLSQVLGLSWLYFYTKVKPKTWLRPFVNTAPAYSVH